MPPMVMPLNRTTPRNSSDSQFLEIWGYAELVPDGVTGSPGYSRQFQGGFQKIEFDRTLKHVVIDIPASTSGQVELWLWVNYRFWHQEDKLVNGSVSFGVKWEYEATDDGRVLVGKHGPVHTEGDDDITVARGYIAPIHNTLAPAQSVSFVPDLTVPADCKEALRPLERMTAVLRSRGTVRLVSVAGSVYFQFAKSDVTDASYTWLKKGVELLAEQKKVVNRLLAKQRITITLKGYASRPGGAAKNAELSQARLAAVRQHILGLWGRHFDHSPQVVTTSYGEDTARSNSHPDEQRVDVKVEFTVGEADAKVMNKLTERWPTPPTPERRR